MTRLLRRALDAWRCLLARDPAQLVFAFAAWSALSGISLAMPGSAFLASPAVYAVQRKLGIPEDLCGWSMIADAALLLYALHPRTSATVRTAIGILTGCAWTAWGCMMSASGFQAGFFSAGGAWTVLTALAVSGSTGSWIRHLPAGLR